MSNNFPYTTSNIECMVLYALQKIIVQLKLHLIIKPYSLGRDPIKAMHTTKIENHLRDIDILSDNKPPLWNNNN